MSDAYGTVRPMTEADYGAGYYAAPAMPPGSRAAGNNCAAGRDHPFREAMVGAVIAATALWVVPRVLEYITDMIQGDEYEFEDGGEEGEA